MSDIPEPGIDTLNEATEQYLRSSDQISYPLALASKFPRIANELVSLKAEPEKLKVCFDGLTKDQRGTRRGFTFEVLMDLHHLGARHGKPYSAVGCVNQATTTLTRAAVIMTPSDFCSFAASLFFRAAVRPTSG